MGVQVTGWRRLASAAALVAATAFSLGCGDETPAAGTPGGVAAGSGGAGGGGGASGSGGGAGASAIAGGTAGGSGGGAGASATGGEAGASAGEGSEAGTAGASGPTWPAAYDPASRFDPGRFTDDTPPLAPCDTGVTITPDDPTTVDAGIRAAQQAGCAGVTIPAGTYHLPPGADRWHLGLSGASDFVIDARGAELILTEPTQGAIEFWNCQRVTLRGGTFIHDPLPFTQGTIVAVAADGLSIDVQIAAGYPANFDDDTYFSPTPAGYVFDGVTRQWKAGSHDLYSQSRERLADGLFRIHYGGDVRSGSTLAAGDPIAFRGNSISDIYVGSSSGVSVIGTIIQSGGGFCLHEDGGDGGHFYSYAVTYGPPPSGASEPPLIASNADAFHSSGVRQGPTLEHCWFEGMCDDGIPIHGAYCLIVEGQDDQFTATGGCGLRDGDTVRFYDARVEPAGTATVVSVADLAGYTPPALTSQYEHFADLPSRSFFQVTVDRSLTVGFDWLLGNANAIGSGFVLRNNVVRNHRARGMLLKADNGLVEGNVVDGSTIDGIVLAPELWWNEADYSHQVTIINNRILHTGYAMVGPWTAQAGAVTILGEANGPPGHAQLVVSDNSFESNDGINLLVHSASDVFVSRNRFVHAQHQASNRGADTWDPTALIYVAYSDDVRFAENTVHDRGAAGAELVQSGPGATQIQGADTGVQVVP